MQESQVTDEYSTDFCDSFDRGQGAGGPAQAIQAALTMSRAERRSRHQKLLVTLRKSDIHRWQTRFVDELIKCTSKRSLAGRRGRSAAGRNALPNSDIPPVRA